MHKYNIIKLNILQGIKAKVLSFFAFVSGAIHKIYARIRANRRLCWFIGLMGKYLLCGLVLLAWTIAATRYGQKQALETYRGWLEEYKIEQEAAAMEAIETDPYTIQLRQEATLMAKTLAGIKDYHYDATNKKIFIQGALNRMENSAYPDNLEDVLLQPGAFEMFDYSNKALEEDYQLALEYIDKYHKSERLLCDPDMVFIELGKDRVTLRDTLHKTSQTNYWRLQE